MSTFINNFRKILIIALFPLMLVSSFYASWCFWSSQNFLYALWYDHTELEEFINYYAPQNKFEPEFSQTNREERIRLFGEIVKSINSKGVGLEQIQYFSPSGELLGRLLSKDEIIHLLEVSNLVNLFKQISWLSIALFFIFIAFIFFTKTKESINIKKISLAYIVLFTIIFIVAFIIGPLNIFEFLHELVFPQGHQWFFYYQDSLMTTLMMAPKLFMYFAAIWISLSLLLFYSMILFFRKIIQD